MRSIRGEMGWGVGLRAQGNTVQLGRLALADVLQISRLVTH
jgi:hypothetical protein